MPGANDSVGRKGGGGIKERVQGRESLQSWSASPSLRLLLQASVDHSLSAPFTFLGLLLAIFGNTDFYQSSQSGSYDRSVMWCEGQN